MVYILNKKTWVVVGKFANLQLAQENLCRLKGDYELLQEVDVSYVSQIVFIDNACIYNNIPFWTGVTKLGSVSMINDVLNNYDNHKVLDYLGNVVAKSRFILESGKNSVRLSNIDGQPAETTLNKTLGSEFVGLFRSEFSKASVDASLKYAIMSKMSGVCSALLGGAFDLAEYQITQITNDSFLTPERVSKYTMMLKSADAFTYAT